MTSVMKENRRYAFAVLLMLAAATVLMPFNARLLVDIFATGYSDAKLILFPIFCFMVFGLYFKERGNGEEGYRNTVGRVLAAMGLLFMTGILLYLYLVSKTGVDGFTRYYIVRDGFLTSEVLDHMHTLKPVIGWPTEFFPNTSYAADFGYPFMGYIPFYAYIPLSMALLYVLYQLGKIIPCIGARSGYSISVFLMISISLFNMLKNIVDGGLFNAQLTASMAVFLYMLFRDEKSNRNKKIKVLAIAAISFFALQLMLQNIIVAYLNNEWRGDIALVMLELMVANQDTYILAALYVMIYASFRALDKKPTIIKLALSAIFFIILFSSLVRIAEMDEFFGSSLTFSKVIYSRATETIYQGTGVSFLTKNNWKVESDFFNIMHSEPLRSYTVVWGYPNRTVKGDEILALTDAPPARRNQKTYCDYAPIDYNDTILFRTKDYEISPDDIKNPLLEIRKFGNREGEYVAEMKYCTPSKQVVLMEVLSEYDDLFAIEMVGAKRERNDSFFSQGDSNILP